jgi:hypothetical protein
MDSFLSTFFVLGLITVAAYAWQRFNEPSFPTGDTLPHTVSPLRYLFLRSAYQRARYVYLAASLAVYCILVAPSESMAKALQKLGLPEFPPQAWPLVVALLIAGLLPNSNVKFLTVIEEWLRRLVHAYFLVPDRIERTIGILQDADYDPPLNQLNAVASPLREQLQEDLHLPRSSLRYRWARAGMLMESLNQMGAGAHHPLKKAAFDPFEDDLEEIRARYKALAQDIAALGDPTAEKVLNLTKAVNSLLKRIYAYISWGVQYQADSERTVDDILEELGFRIPDVGRRRMFDIVAPAILLVSAITVMFSLGIDALDRWLEIPKTPLMHESARLALIAAAAAAGMYGRAVYIALNQRQIQIEQRTWRHGSPSRLLPIAIRAGLVSWGVIVLVTLIGRFPDVLQSLPGLAEVIKSLSVTAAASTSGAAPWNLLPLKIITAFPWLLAGATVGVLLAVRLGGDVRRTSVRARVHDALWLGVGLGVAAVAAQLFQTSFEAREINLYSIASTGVAGSLCGAVIGFMIPCACRANIVTPPSPEAAAALRNLLQRAAILRGSEAAAKDWVFTPHDYLDGVTPAEAIQYEGRATGVRRLLEGNVQGSENEVRPEGAQRRFPVAIEDGKASRSNAA